jgi:hypothetical protein
MFATVIMKVSVVSIGAREGCRNGYTRVYIYIHTSKADRLVLQTRPTTHRNNYQGDKGEKERSHGPAKKETETRSFLSAHNVPIRAQATPDNPDNQDTDHTDHTDRPQTDPNGPKQDPRRTQDPCWETSVG